MGARDGNAELELPRIGKRRQASAFRDEAQRRRQQPVHVGRVHVLDEHEQRVPFLKHDALMPRDHEARSVTVVEASGARRQAHLVTGEPEAPTQVHVFEVREECWIEAADVEKELAVHEERAAASEQEHQSDYHDRTK